MLPIQKYMVKQWQLITKKEFIENGIIDTKSHTYPDICKHAKSTVIQAQEDLVFKHFSDLYSVMQRDGHIAKDIYDNLVFSINTNYAGDKVPKPDEISQEMRHREFPLMLNPPEKGEVRFVRKKIKREIKS